MTCIPEPLHNPKEELPVGVRLPGGIQDGLSRITDERRHQRVDHGYNVDHDQHHQIQELIDAANCYLYEVVYVDDVPIDQKMGTDLAKVEIRSGSSTPCPSSWPWEPEAWKPSDDKIHNLEKAGALYKATEELMRRATYNIADYIDAELQQRLQKARVL